MKTLYYNELELGFISKIILASLENKLVYLGIDGNDLDYYASKLSLKVKKDQNSSIEVIEQLKQYFAKERKYFDIETEFLFGTDFQRKVWAELQKIEYSKFITYKELAVRVNKSTACRAVGNANGQNPIPIIIPCHRVIASNAKLGGYSCGIDVKKQLLNLELGYCKFI